jgi:hypothetical protein
MARRILDHVLKVDDDSGVADHPGGVAARRRRNVARLEVELSFSR